MSIEKVELELNSGHACTGHVLACNETGRTIGSFWHEDDAGDAAMKINNHDDLIAALRVTANELNSYIEAENKRLKKNICSTDLDDPDYHDQQTVHEAFKLIHELTGKY